MILSNSPINNIICEINYGYNNKINLIIMKLSGDMRKRDSKAIRFGSS